MVQMAKYTLPAMTKNEGEVKGSIINIGSVAGLKGGTPYLLYPTAKGAVVNLTRAMAAQHALEGVRASPDPAAGFPQTQVAIRPGTPLPSKFTQTTQACAMSDEKNPSAATPPLDDAEVARSGSKQDSTML